MIEMMVAGAGLAGLAVALFAARDGHEVVVLEADGRAVPEAAPDLWREWRRRGVPQFRQLHATQALGRAILAARAPDVLAALHTVGAGEAELVAGSAPSAAELVQLRCRRPLVEWVLRNAVLAEPGVVFRSGTGVTGLLLDGSCRTRVRGVVTTSRGLAADLVVDATGRRSRVADWCEQAGAPAPRVRTVEPGQAYYTRWWRRSSPFTAADPVLRIELPFATLLLCPADADWFSATFFAPLHDRALRRLLMDPDGFLAAVRSVPAAAARLEDARPVGDVQFMAGLVNQLRRPARDGRSPIGLLAVGDSAVCTNPTWGRGAALALASAAALVDVMKRGRHAVGRHRGPREVDRRAARAVVPRRAPPRRRDERGLGGRAPLHPLGAPLPPLGCVAAARIDPDVGVAYLRYRNLLDPPEAFWCDAGIADRVRAAAATQPGEVALPSRQQCLDTCHA